MIDRKDRDRFCAYFRQEESRELAANIVVAIASGNRTDGVVRDFVLYLDAITRGTDVTESERISVESRIKVKCRTCAGFGIARGSHRSNCDGDGGYSGRDHCSGCEPCSACGGSRFEARS